MQAGSLSLNFNCTCWQNRKARIYLSGAEFEAAADQTFRRNLELGTTRIVLSRNSAVGEPKKVLLPDGTTCTILADPGNNSFHCEFQVWKRSKAGTLSLFLDPELPAQAPITASETANRHLLSPSNSSTSLYSDVDANATTPSTESTSSATSSSTEHPIVVERALRSRVAYSERPSKLVTHPLLKEDAIRMAHVALCNDRVYCTIDCMKGLKVQMLAIVCIFRIGDKHFASNFTSFPPPSSLKRKERSRVARPKRAAPYRKRFMEDEDDGDLDEAEDPTTLHDMGVCSTGNGINGINPMGLASPLGGNAGSALGNAAAGSSAAQQQLLLSKKMSPVVGSNMAMPTLDSTTAHALANGNLKQSRAGMVPNAASAAVAAAVSRAPRFHPATLPASSPDSMKPSLYGSPMPSHSDAPFRQAAWAIVYHRLRSIATPYVEHTLASISRVACLQTLFSGTSNHNAHDDLARWCLYGNTPIESKLVAGLLDIFSVPCFVGHLENARAFELLSYSLPASALGTFILRISKEEYPSLEVYGVFRGAPQSNDLSTPPPLQEYCATIRYHVSPDPHVPAVFWIDTEMNQDNRSTTAAGLVNYISKVTTWIPLDRDAVTPDSQWSTPAPVSYAPQPQTLASPSLNGTLGNGSLNWRNSWHSAMSASPDPTLFPLIQSPFQFSPFYPTDDLQPPATGDGVL